MLARVLTAFILMPTVLAILWFDPLDRGVFLLINLTSAGLSAEYLHLVRRRVPGVGWFEFLIIWSAALVWTLDLGEPGLGQWLDVIVIVVAFAAFLPVLVSGDVSGAFARIAATTLGAVYVGWAFARHAMALYDHGGVAWLFVLLAAVWVSDSAAYFVGRSFGTHRLAPAISPAKTWEGAGAGLLGAIAAAGIVGWFLVSDRLPTALGVGVVVGTIGPLSDLFESALKRDADVKDSGNWLPGHGGLLDRLDSLVFTVPAVYYYLLASGALL